MTKSSEVDDEITSLLKLAQSRHQQGGLPEALALYRQVLIADPRNADALQGIGVLYGQSGRFEQSVKFLFAATDVQPENFAAHYNLGKALQALNQSEAALASYNKTLSLRPEYIPAYNNRGNVRRDLRRYAEALGDYDQALSLKSDYAEAHFNRGNALTSLQRYQEALAAYDTALSLGIASAEIHNARGVALCRLGQSDAALDSFAAALAIEPGWAEVHGNRGFALQNMQRYAEALAEYDQAIGLSPDYAEAQFNKSRLLLLQGRYREGWALFEWRWRVAKNRGYARHFKQDLWLGEQSIAGKTILLHAEQGFGDVIQFVRYVSMVEALGARVILGVPPDLVTLLRSLNATFTPATRTDARPAFDLHCPLMSLPLALGTTLDTIPAAGPYLAADLDKRGEWRSRLGSRCGPRIGIAWSGSPAHPNERNRSLSLRSLAPLLRLDFEYHSLQKEVRAADEAAMSEYPQLATHAGELHDFAETAALVAEMDLVITVDTVIAHLAGALGKPVWILLPYAPDYRWMTERHDSPWYPSARLFRQRSGGDWQGVMDEVCEALRRMNFP
ncbi:MAG: tetratricopeptide repeat protein [Gammaproteobacteria bacterium]